MLFLKDVKLVECLNLIYASGLAARGTCGVIYSNDLRRFEHLYLCAGWNVCFAGDVKWMAIVTTHTLCFWAERSGERAAFPRTEFELLCFDKAVFITGCLCNGSSLSSLSHPETLGQLSGSRGRV